MNQTSKQPLLLGTPPFTYLYNPPSPTNLLIQQQIVHLPKLVNPSVVSPPEDKTDLMCGNATQQEYLSIRYDSKEGFESPAFKLRDLVLRDPIREGGWVYDGGVCIGLCIYFICNLVDNSSHCITGWCEFALYSFPICMIPVCLWTSENCGHILLYCVLSGRSNVQDFMKG